MDKELLKYITCFEKRLNTANKEVYVFIVHFPEKWDAYPSDDNRILVQAAEDGSYFYVGEVDSVEYDDIIRLIKDTIEINMEAERKCAMFQEKVNELREIFSGRRTYQELSTVTICIDGKPYTRTEPTKPVMKTISQAKEAVPFPEPVEETPVEAQKANFKDTLKQISKKTPRTAAAKKPIQAPAPVMKQAPVRKATKKTGGEYMSLDEVEELEKRFG